MGRSNGDRDEDYSSQPLTEREIRQVRRELEQSRRVRWFWQSTKTTGLWIAAVVGGIWALQEFLARVVKALIR